MYAGGGLSPRTSDQAVISQARTAALRKLTGKTADLQQMKEADHRLAERIVAQVQQNGRFLDACLQEYAETPLSRLRPDVLAILRLSAAQLLFFERVPASAAVNDAVAMCRRNKAPYAAGFVNAVLRRVAADRDRLLSADREPAVRYSHPDWLADLLREQFDEETMLGFMKANQEIPSLCLQVNTLRIPFQDYLRMISDQGIIIRSVNEPLASLRTDSIPVESLPGYHEGLFYIQDDAARMAVKLALVGQGQKVLDACAAPGGKSMAAALDGAEQITACDISTVRLKRCRENFSRLSLKIPTCCADAAEFRAEWERTFDVVLADVPCSGTGIIRKQPEIRTKSREDMESLLPVQSGILNNLSRYVRPGGILLYSTCSVLKNEDECQTAAFLRSHPEFMLEEEFRSWPQYSGNDGFYAARIRRQ